MRKLTTEEFIKKAREIHGDKYDYSKVNYINSRTKVCIICPEHGEFWQLPIVHYKRKQGCPVCNGNILTTEEFIKKARKVHGNKYDYSKVNYVNSQTKVCIICPEHGEFWQNPCSHMNNVGCPKCYYKKSSINKRNSIHNFIERAIEVHGNKYDYSKVNYVNSQTKVCIICPEHGEFWQTPHNHLAGQGCMKCKLKEQSIRLKCTTDKFIEKARKVHGDKYDYSKVNYIDSHTKVCIICPEHGEFWQKPDNHLNGWGCTICGESHLEKDMRNYLINNNIKFEEQKTFDWLKYKSNLYLDFYLPDYNIAIECQGIQHFRPIDFAGKGKEWADEHFKIVKNRDIKKKELCEEHELKLLYYTENNKDNFKING